jgi:hypothetical protein
MRRIIQANIERFNELLKSETDPTKRAFSKRGRHGPASWARGNSGNFHVVCSS